MSRVDRADHSQAQPTIICSPGASSRGQLEPGEQGELWGLARLVVLFLPNPCVLTALSPLDICGLVFSRVCLCQKCSCGAGTSLLWLPLSLPLEPQACLRRTVQTWPAFSFLLESFVSWTLVAAVISPAAEGGGRRLPVVLSCCPPVSGEGG